MDATSGIRTNEYAEELSPELEYGLNCMAAVLTHEDDALRQKAVWSVVYHPLAQVRTLIIGRLIDSLLSPSKAVKSRAANSLVAMGACAVPSLTRAMRNSDNEDVQVAAAVVLARLAPSLSPCEQGAVYQDLLILGTNTDSLRVVMAVNEVLAAFPP